MIDLSFCKRIILSRTDNIGDVVLTLPMAGILKEAYPHLEIIMLARDYVEAIVQAYPQIDRFISSDRLLQLEKAQAATELAELEADVIIHVFPNQKIAALAKAAKITHRIGTSRRWYHWLYCNLRLSFSRARSVLHEAQLNLKLLSPFNQADDYSIDSLKPFAKLKPHPVLATHWANLLVDDRCNVVIHPMSNGNGREWPVSYYRDLIRQLPRDKFKIFITGSPAEQEKLASSLIAQCEDIIDLTGQLSLPEFIDLLSRVDLYLGSSTGPLHIAASLGTEVIGLFPPAAKLNAERWGPIGEKTQVITSKKTCQQCMPEAGSCPCMLAILPELLCATINERCSHH